MKALIILTILSGYTAPECPQAIIPTVSVVVDGQTFDIPVQAPVCDAKDEEEA